jgi:hypothetical protein
LTANYSQADLEKAGGFSEEAHNEALKKEIYF